MVESGVALVWRVISPMVPVQTWRWGSVCSTQFRAQDGRNSWY